MSEPRESVEYTKKGRPRNRVYDLRYRTGAQMVNMDGVITDRDPSEAIGIGRAFCLAHGVRFVCLVERLSLTRELLDMDPEAIQASYKIGSDRIIR